MYDPIFRVLDSLSFQAETRKGKESWWKEKKFPFSSRFHLFSVGGLKIYRKEVGPWKKYGKVVFNELHHRRRKNFTFCCTIYIYPPKMAQKWKDTLLLNIKKNKLLKVKQRNKQLLSTARFLFLFSFYLLSSPHSFALLAAKAKSVGPIKWAALLLVTQKNTRLKKKKSFLQLPCNYFNNPKKKRKKKISISFFSLYLTHTRKKGISEKQNPVKSWKIKI